MENICEFSKPFDARVVLPQRKTNGTFISDLKPLDISISKDGGEFKPRDGKKQLRIGARDMQMQLIVPLSDIDTEAATIVIMVTSDTTEIVCGVYITYADSAAYFSS